MSFAEITMSQKEVQRLEVINLLAAGKLKQKDAAMLLGVGVRQIKRLKKKHQDAGAFGLVSRRRGRPSSNQICEKLKREALQKVRFNYVDFGPTLALEKLSKDHGIRVSKETLRKWMIEDGIWGEKRRKKFSSSNSELWKHSHCSWESRW